MAAVVVGAAAMGIVGVAAVGVLLVGPLTVYAAWTERDRTHPHRPSQHCDTCPPQRPGQPAALPDTGRRSRQPDPGGQAMA